MYVASVVFHYHLNPLLQVDVIGCLITGFYIRDSRDNFEPQKLLQRSRQNDDDGGDRVSVPVSSPVLSMLIIPSVKEVRLWINDYFFVLSAPLFRHIL